MPTPKIPQRIKTLLSKFDKNQKTTDFSAKSLERSLIATSLYLANCDMDTIYGQFHAYIFQDIIHHGYIIALTYGPYQTASTLVTRIHSSCVTSETLRGCDCDCVQQLEGAMERITQHGSGILYYLMQEGRGVGYIAKARDRMLVQASEDHISTFEAYHRLGLSNDYRQYRNVKPINDMLGVKGSYILLTNNPDKIDKFKSFGLKLKRAEPLEFKPSPFNLAYLSSKEAEGHRLKQPAISTYARVTPPWPIEPIKPHALPKATRFIYTASYFLPIRPVDDEIILTQNEFENIFKNHKIDELTESKPPLAHSYEFLRHHRIKIKLNRKNFLPFKNKNPKHPFCELVHIPYWFQVHLYFDIVSNEEYILLTYGNIRKSSTPVVRFQSESLFNRFPLVESDNQSKYKSALQEIMEYGCGIIVQLSNDGRGSGLGAYTYDVMLHQNKLSRSTKDSYEKLGVKYDRRDYDAAVALLCEHVPSKQIQMVVNSPDSLVRKTELNDALNQYNLDVKKWVFLESDKVDHHE